MDVIQKQLLEAVAGLHETPTGAYNIRANGESTARNTTANIDIVSKKDVSGIDIIIKPGTKKESVHIPVVVSATGPQDAMSRHRGAKPPRRCELLGVISLLSPG